MPARTRVQLLQASDFRLGLNLRADAFQLADTESPDLLNVDLDPRGGFALRRGVHRMNETAEASAPHSITAFTAAGGGTKQVVVGVGTTARYSTGGDFTNIVTGLSSSNRQRYAVYKDNLYIQNGVDAPRRWTGSAVTTLTQTFNDDLAAPDDGDMPIAYCIASHLSYVWVANTTESATAHRNRVRWSHPNRPEDYRTLDYIDVDIGRDGDEIRALIPFRDRLLVFKRNSLHEIAGYDPDTFQVLPISDSVGTISQESVVETDNGVYFFSWPDGLFFYDGKKLKWLFERISPAILDGTIPDDQQDDICVGWLNRRVWVAVPWGSAQTTNNRVLVFDPSLGKEGGWTLYDVPVGPMVEWRPPGAEVIPLGCGIGDTKRVLHMDHHHQEAQDDFGAGDVDISSYYFTRWYDGGSPSIKKRWKRPDIIVDSDEAHDIRVQVYKDYDPGTIRRQFIVEVEPPSGDVWNGTNWGEGEWSAPLEGSQQIERGSSFGRARAVQLKFTGPSGPSVHWSVNSINMKILPKRLR